MTKHKYSPSTGGFYLAASIDQYRNLPTDLVDVSDDLYDQVVKVVVAGKNGLPILQDPPPPPPPDTKIVGVEFEGVMCSATREDQNGLVAVLLAFQMQGKNFQPTEFSFSNGNKVVLNAGNMQKFISVWMPFRQSFFLPSE